MTPNTSNSSEAARFAKMKIMIVDDEQSNTALLEALLAGNGYTRLKSVTDSRQALETCLTFAPDLILLDLIMPEPDGFSVLQSLRSGQPETFLPVIVLTADANQETKRKALRLGATDFLLKPFDHLEVLLRIGNLLETRRLHLQLDLHRAAYEDALRTATSDLRDVQSQLDKVRA